MMSEGSKLLKEAVGAGGWTRVCDSCRAAACTVYCQADLAYLCIGCDTCIHAVNSGAWMHERVLVCEACECAPASFSCKADAAALCINCDAKIHSANALARRHQRVPILPIAGILDGPSALLRYGPKIHVDDVFLAQKTEDEDREDETSFWLLLNPVKSKNQSNNNNNGFVFGNEVEEYLDLDEYNSCPETSQYYVNDSVVPVQCVTVKQQEQEQPQHIQQHQPNYQMEMDFEASKSGFNYSATSISHSVSMSSMDTGIVPDTINLNEVSNSNTRCSSKGTIDLFTNPPVQMPTQFSSIDREARVLKYREKRKTRKFEKTIRYASRKAYAETRPRIKGRFAKRTDAEFEVDQMFSSSVMSENGYGVVPLF